VYAYIVKHNYVLGGMLFTIRKAQLHVSATILQPDDGQNLWSKRVVVLYV